LHSPNDAFDEPGAVGGFGVLAEEFGESLPQLADAEPLERRHLVDDVEFHRSRPSSGAGSLAGGFEPKEMLARQVW
jgi:hypothetical protein